MWSKQIETMKNEFRTILYETERLKIEHEYEATYLIDKLVNETLLEDNFYGDPDCALIDKDNNWAIMAGEHLTFWTYENWKRIENEDLKDIHSIRQKDFYTVEILIDPWSEKPAIWELNILSFEYKRIRGFYDYKDEMYKDTVIW
ncbi:hypothetical protein [Tenacibaculum ovolyticum]|uniref:hypothetical protein n=1 Tax=Tenacibaculum ovolyticum TaxID=104270 RepID=UPI0012DF804B|nr:hypothetical protein [Tenacibaculum ovolyticum]